MGIGEILIIIGAVALVAGVLIAAVIRKKKGKTSCDCRCGCSHCSDCCSTNKK